MARMPRHSTRFARSGQDLRFYLVDVFAHEPLAGNPLAVVADADAIPEQTMRRIAREFNQSETTFVLKPTRSEADWRLRFFTPTGAEVYGAGHNALGAWWWLAAADRLAPGRSTYHQELGDRVLPVEIVVQGSTLDRVGMIQAPPSFGAVHDDRDALAGALRIRSDDIDGDRLPPQVVSTGVPHLLVAVRDRAAVARLDPDAPRLIAEVSRIGGQGCYVYCLDPFDRASTAHARFFNPAVGISEDPATGSAAGPLGAYLTKRGLVAEDAPILVEQGFAVGRPSVIDVRVRGDRVQVSGRCVIVGEGTLHV
jgi:PhzF family phenazine biosynthesis protein